MITYYAFTDKGDREINEDSLRAVALEEKFLFLVADGLGGHGRGEEASALVVDSIFRNFKENSSVDTFMEEQTVVAQNELMAEQDRKKTRNEMKTTLVSLMIDGFNAKWLYVGDSRLYRFNKNKVVERTIDHSVPQMLVMTGEIKEKQIRNHPDRNRLLKVMGVNWDGPQYTVSDINNVMKIQAFLLCTDGFWELITEKEMCKLLKKAKTVEEWVKSMAQVVKANGEGKNMDNYTAIGVWCS